MAGPLAFLQDQKIQAGAMDAKGPQENHGLMACADELIKAIKAEDRKGVMMALASAFDLLDAMPHEEGPHEGGE